MKLAIAGLLLMCTTCISTKKLGLKMILRFC
jgi:hypothetical protein